MTVALGAASTIRSNNSSVRVPARVFITFSFDCHAPDVGFFGPVPSTALGPIQGGGGGLEKRVQSLRLRWGEHRDTEAGGEGKGLLLVTYRLGDDPLTSPLGQLHGACLAASGRHGQKPLATVAPYMVVGPYGGSQPSCVFPQHLVAAQAPAGIVNSFEVIEIGQH
jgi:hypothetical protein